MKLPLLHQIYRKCVNALVVGLSAITAGNLALAQVPDSYSLEHLNFLKTERELTETEHKKSIAKQTNAGLEVESVDARLTRTTNARDRLERTIARKETDLLNVAVRISETQRARTIAKNGIEDLLVAQLIADRNKPIPLLATTNQMNAAIRTSLLVSDVVPGLSERIKSLKEIEERLARETEQFHTQRKGLKKDEANLKRKEAEIKLLLEQKRNQYASVSEATRALADKLTKFTQDITTLDRLLKDLEKATPINPEVKPGLRQRESTITALYRANAILRPDLELKPLGEAKYKRLVLPVIGRITERFNSTTSTDSISLGLGIETEQQKPVLAPADGKITFAGDFGIYGQTVILQTVDGYHIVMYGFGKIYGAVSQKVLTGELIGQTSNRSDPPPKLVIELRKEDEHLDPENWME